MKIRNEVLRETVVIYTSNHQPQENNLRTSSPSPSVLPYSRSEIEIKNMYRKLPAYETIQVMPAANHTPHIITTGDVNGPEQPPRYDTLYPEWTI